MRKIKINFFQKQFEKYKIVILLIPILSILSLTYAVSRSFLVEGRENNNLGKEFKIYENLSQDDIALTCGDIDGDGKDEIMSRATNNSNLKIFNENGNTRDIYKNIFKNNKDSFNIKAGDINGDGQDEIVKYMTEGKSIIEILQNKNTINKFESFENLNIGVSVELADINNDAKEEIIVGAGAGGGPQVKIFSESGVELSSFFAFNPVLRNGINIEVGNADEELDKEIIVSQKKGGEGIVRIFKLDDLKTFYATFLAYPTAIKGGTNIFAFDFNHDNKTEIVTTKDVEGEDAEIKIFNPFGGLENIDYSALSNMTNKSKVAVCNFNGKQAIIFSFQNGRDVNLKVIYNY